MRTIKIKKGRHMASNQFTRPSLSPFVWRKRVLFTESCRYVLDDPSQQKDWNKLGGFGTGVFPLVKQFMAHEDSFRYGWRYNQSSGLMEISPYYYIDGERFYAETLGIKPVSVNVGEMVEFQICKMPFWGSILFAINKKEVFSVKFNKSYALGWEYPLYFGGTLPAPHDMEIKLF